MKKSVICLVAAGALVATSIATASPAAANGGDPPVAGEPVTIAEGLVTPLSLEVDRQRVSYVTQNFTGILTRIARDGTTTELASAPGEEISAVSSRDGYVYYAQIAQDHSSGVFKRVPAAGGEPEVVADLWAHENSENPDGDVSYGFQGISDECAAQFPEPGPMISPAVYTGLVDIHPYSSLALNNAVFVADAGANAITRVGYDGTVSTVAVLPPQAPIEVTEDLLAIIPPDQGIPDCVLGSSVILEPVPTDIEIGPDGWLYVTTLPGGPETPALGGRGSVYKVNPKTGEVGLVASGFTTSTNLAVATDGTIYVTELFGGPEGAGQISVLPKGATEPVVLAAVPQPAAIEIRSNRLFVTWNALSETGANYSVIEVD